MADANRTLIVDASGRPFRARAQAGGGLPNGTPLANFPYDAANWQTQEMGNWLPWLRSPDAEINQFRDRMVARSRDLVRNDGWAVGGIQRVLDNTVGASFRLYANPDYRALQYWSSKFDAAWAREFQREAEALWRGFSEDIGRYNDVERQLTVAQQQRLALRHKLVDGDALMAIYWLPNRVGYGAAQYATSFQLLDPDRLSNPMEAQDDKYMRGGVEIDDFGVPVAYHIRKAQQNDWYNSVESMIWERVPREDPDGWRRVIHDFERDRAGQHRGIGLLVPILSHMRMLARYYGVELQAATVAASLGTYVTSPYDPALVEEALDDDTSLKAYQQLRADWAEKRPAMFNGVRIPTLAPGEDIKQVSGAHPHTGFEPFAKEMLRTFAAASGMSAEQVTQDWSKTNYSSARAALLESWKTLVRRREEFAVGFASPMYAAWLREAMERGDLPLPAGAPDFVEAATHYARCTWLGPGRGWIDPVKERQGSVLAIQNGLSSLRHEVAENSGEDFEDVLDQLAAEKAAYEERGLPMPPWLDPNSIKADGADLPDQPSVAQAA